GPIRALCIFGARRLLSGIPAEVRAQVDVDEDLPGRAVRRTTGRAAVRVRRLVPADLAVGTLGVRAGARAAPRGRRGRLRAAVRHRDALAGPARRTLLTAATAVRFVGRDVDARAAAAPLGRGRAAQRAI